MSFDWFFQSQAIFFDFDGVLADSVDIKTKAFVDLYRKDYPEITDRVTEYHLKHGGVSRFEKIEYYETELLGRPYSQERINELAALFSTLVVEHVVASQEIPGVSKLLDALYAQQIPCFVVSGTPQSELASIVEKRHMSNYFVSVHGSQTTKTEILKNLLITHEYDAGKCLMVGDASTDYNAAQNVGMRFLGVASAGQSPFPIGTEIVENLVIPPIS